MTSHNTRTKAGEFGELHDYNTGKLIRSATETELIDSQRAARTDGGAGVIHVDGLACYVTPNELHRKLMSHCSVLSCPIAYQHPSHFIAYCGNRRMHDAHTEPTPRHAANIATPESAHCPGISSNVQDVLEGLPHAAPGHWDAYALLTMSRAGERIGGDYSYYKAAHGHYSAAELRAMAEER